MPFDFFFVPLCFFAMALLLERAPTRRNSGALQVTANEPIGAGWIVANIAKLPELLTKPR